MAVHCQDLTLGAFSSCSALFVLVVALFKKFGLFLYTPRMSFQYKQVQNLLSINKPSLFGKELSQSYKLNAFLMPFFFPGLYSSNLSQRTSCQGNQNFTHSPYCNLIFFFIPHAYATCHARLFHQLK